MKHIATIADVAERQLCTGCGACAYVQPDVIRMVDDVDYGRRPVVRPEASLPGSTDDALSACPGVGLGHDGAIPGAIAELADTWGPVLEVWEGYACDDDLRFRASSGGVSSALAIFAIEERDFGGLLHIRARADVPYLNETVLSEDRASIVDAVGSRYAPASPCDGLGLVEAHHSPVVMIGKPCDIAGASKAESVRPALSERLGLKVAIFCAGTPSLRGTFEMLTAMGIEDAAEVTGVRYRGHGWPGDATATVRSDGTGEPARSLTYEESWGAILQRHRQWRCYVCADHTGEFADIAVGDPWYRPPERGEPGRSIILIRTERGREFFHAALDAGAVAARRQAPHRLPDSQPWLGRVRGEVGARTTTLRVLGVPTPRYRNMPMWSAWRRNLTLGQKLRSPFSTLRRVRRKRLRHRHPVRPFGGDFGDSPSHQRRS